MGSCLGAVGQPFVPVLFSACVVGVKEVGGKFVFRVRAIQRQAPSSLPPDPLPPGLPTGPAPACRPTPIRPARARPPDLRPDADFAAATLEEPVACLKSDRYRLLVRVILSKKDGSCRTLETKEKEHKGGNGKGKRDKGM